MKKKGGKDGAEAVSDLCAILKEELIPALGCTEPIAIAYASAKAREVLGCFPEKAEIYCSGNIIKNVKGVTVPNSGGLRGIEATAILGIMGGDAKRELEVLESVTAQDIEKTRELAEKGFCQCILKEGVENLFIRARVLNGDHSAEVTIANRHTNITKIVKDGQVLYAAKGEEQTEKQADRGLLNIRDILLFAQEVAIEDIREPIARQIAMNTAICSEGLQGVYGAEVGKTLLEVYGDDVKVRARAKAAAGSDARMGGCSLPVVINSGSGNQGVTVSLPVLEYAKELGASEETTYRALVISNLIAVHQKKYIGKLSAYCGAVSAASGAGAAITWLCGGTEEEINLTIVNTLGDVGGIVCDGAKASCAAKIASSVEAAIMAHSMAMKHRAFQPGEGIVKEDVESTIQSIGYVGRIGMKRTDVEILNVMIDQVDFSRR